MWASIPTSKNMEDTLQKLVLEELQAIGLARATDVVGIQGGTLTVKDTDTLPPNLSPAVASIEKTSGGLKIKFYDKLKALELLGKYTGLFDEPGQHKPKENNLLQTIIQSTKEDLRYDDLPEVQQAAAAGDDLVEQTPMETV